MKRIDNLIIGAGIFGLYASIKSSGKGFNTLIVDVEHEPFKRGSFINQARLHNGYHYPRSMATAKKSSKYFIRFHKDFSTCINSEFKQIYATSSKYSWTSGEQFKKFCKDANIYCIENDVEEFFNSNLVDKSFITEEYSFDASLIRDKLMKEAEQNGVVFKFSTTIKSAIKDDEDYLITLSGGEQLLCKKVINATYAGVNQIHKIFGFETLPIKYELCEVALCKVSQNIKNVGLTVMDGPFFSVMPFGKTGLHSITTVSKTPHNTSYDALPTFDCQIKNKNCSSSLTENCNTCEFRPQTAFSEMRQMLKIYTDSKVDVEHIESLFTLKPILVASEIDDSRPTLIKQYSTNPDFFTVFSGKLNTIYDLDSII